jgi:hypothetical protein
MDDIFYTKPIDFNLVKRLQQHRDIMYENKKKDIVKKILLMLDDKLKHT